MDATNVLGNANRQITTLGHDHRLTAQGRSLRPTDWLGCGAAKLMRCVIPPAKPNIRNALLN